MQTRLRPLARGDQRLLVQATLDNLNWQTQRFTEHDLQSRPELWHYTELKPARGDFGFAAELSGGDAIGVSWAQFLPGTDPGYGYLDDSTPEISLWVREDWRGRGVGRRLLRRLQDAAKERGIARLSLSVEAGNSAKRLYAAAGFVDVAGREPEGVMVWSPGPGSSGAVRLQ